MTASIDEHSRVERLLDAQSKALTLFHEANTRGLDHATRFGRANNVAST